MWNVTTLGGKELQLVQEAEQCQLEIVRLTSTLTLGSGNKLLDEGWALSLSEVAQSSRTPVLQVLLQL